MSGLNNILFLDIETVPVAPTFIELPAHGKDTFTKRFRSVYEKLMAEQVVPIEALNSDHQLDVWQQIYEQNVSLLAEYAQVACISMGIVDNDNRLRLTTFSGPDEREILTKAREVLMASVVHQICAHNGKAFDFPFLVRRYLVRGLTVPAKLQIMGLKPWEMRWIYDTMEMWNLADLRYNCGLDRLAYAFGLPSPKGDMDGSKVASVYYSDDPDRFDKIGVYCRADVVTLACVYAYMTGNQLPINLKDHGITEGGSNG